MNERSRRDRSIGRPRDPVLGAMSFRGVMIAIAIVAAVAIGYHVMDLRSSLQSPAIGAASPR